MNPNQAQSSDEIKTETNRTRADIERNLEELEQRLSPDEVLDQVGQAVAPARDGAVQFARNLGDTVRENPIPAAMVGIGLGWLLLSGRRADPAIDVPADRIDPNRPVHDPMADDSNGSRQGRVRETKEWAQKRSEEVREAASDTADNAYRRVADTAYRAGARIGDGTAEVGNFVQRRPILTGAAVAGLGAVIAAAVFARTDRGQAVMSKTSDAVRDGSQRMGEAVRSGAQNVSAAAAEAGSKTGEHLDGVKEKAKTGADTVRETARSRAGDVRDRVRGTGDDANKPGSTDADGSQRPAGHSTRSVAEQANPDPNEPDVAKPVPVSPPPHSEGVLSSDPSTAGVGEIDHHDNVGSRQPVPPIGSKH